MSTSNDEDGAYDPRQTEAFKALTSKGIGTSRNSLGLQSHKRYGSVYIAFKRFLVRFCPEYLNNLDNDKVEFAHFNISTTHFFPWFGCLNEFFTTRKTYSRKKDEEKPVHKKTLAMVLTCVNHIYESKAIPHPFSVLLECKKIIQGFANEVGTMKKNCEMPLEGKKEFSFSEYTQLAQSAVQDALIAAWLFLVLMWALIARSISVALQ